MNQPSDEVKRYYGYIVSKQMLQRLLSDGLISEDEYEIGVDDIATKRGIDAATGLVLPAPAKSVKKETGRTSGISHT